MAIETSHAPDLNEDSDWDKILKELEADSTLRPRSPPEEHFIGMLAQILELEDKVKRLEKELDKYKSMKANYYNLDEGSPFK